MTALLDTPLGARRPLHVIPFELRHSHVVLAAAVNGRAATLILDTGSSAVSLDRDWAMAAGVEPLETPASVLGVGNVAIRLGVARSVRVGQAELTNEMAALVPFDHVSAAHGLAIHGTIGFSFFSRFVVATDYSSRELRLWAPQSYEYAGAGDIIAVDLEHRIPVARTRLIAHDGTRVDARLAIDLGTGGYAALVSPRLYGAHRAVFDAGRSIVTILGSGIGGAASGRGTRLAALEVGTLRIPEPTLALSETASGFFAVTWADGTVGAPAFSDGVVIADYSRRRIIIERAAELRRREFDASGLLLRAIGRGFDSVEVSHVVAGSPADVAGVRSGDRLVSVDDVRVDGAGLDRVCHRLRKDGTRVTIEVERRGSERTFELLLKALL